MSRAKAELIKMNSIENCITIHSYNYCKLIVEELRANQFVEDEYLQKSDVISICNVVEEYLIRNFIQVVEGFIVSFEDIQQFIQLYSYYSKPSTKKELSFRQTCRYILYLLPSLNLVTQESNKSEGENINELCKLIAINNLIQETNQLYGIQSLVDNTCVKINLTKFYSIEYTDAFVIKLNKSLSNSPGLIRKKFLPENSFEKLMSILDKESPTLKIIFGYTSQFIKSCADIFEVSNEVANNNDLLVRGLLFKKDNVNLFKAINAPLDPQFRTRFRPFICLNIDGKERVFTTFWLVYEALDEISSNLLPYANLPKEWMSNSSLKQLSITEQEKNGVDFEKAVAKLIETKYLTRHDIKGFNHISLKDASVPGTNRNVGQIDVLSIDQAKKIIYVIDAKCTKTKYFFQSFQNDKKSFEGYKIKLADKVNWINNNKNIVAQYFGLDFLSDYKVEGFFVSNSLIYFGFFSDIPIIPFDKLLDYLEVKNIKTLFE